MSEKTGGRGCFPTLGNVLIKHYSQFLDAIIKVSDGFLALIRNVIVSLGIPIILILIISVEIPRVAHGVEFLEPDKGFALLTAGVIVISNKVIEFLIVYEQTNAGQTPQYFIFSIRLLFTGIFQLLFSKRAAPAAHRYMIMGNYIMATILLMALLGSMRIAIASLPDDLVWYRAIWDILLGSNLQEILTWTSGTVLTATLVIMARGLTHYIAVHTTKVISELQENREYLLAKQRKLAESRTDLPGEGYIIRNNNEYTAYSSIDSWSRDGYTSIFTATSGVRSHNAAVRKQEILQEQE